MNHYSIEPTWKSLNNQRVNHYLSGQLMNLSLAFVFFFSFRELVCCWSTSGAVELTVQQQQHPLVHMYFASECEMQSVKAIPRES